MVGPQRLVSELSRAVDDAVAGRGGLVLLAGEAGVGKTHLAMQALNHTRLRVIEGSPTLARLAAGAPAMANLCLACMAVVLRQTGEWRQCAQVCRDVLATDSVAPHPRAAALGMLGSIYAHQGHAARARPLLAESARLARQKEVAPLEVLAGSAGGPGELAA